MQVPGFRQAKFLLFPLLHLLFSGHQVLHSTTRQTGKQCIFDSSGNPPTGRTSIVTGERDGSCAGSALDAVTFTAAASSGGGHSADRGGGYGAGLVACRSGLEHVTRQACSSICGLVIASGSLSSHHVDHMCSRSDGGEGDTNSCCDTHGACANACNTLHDARGNSGYM